MTGNDIDECLYELYQDLQMPVSETRKSSNRLLKESLQIIISNLRSNFYHFHFSRACLTQAIQGFHWNVHGKSPHWAGVVLFIISTNFTLLVISLLRNPVSKGAESSKSVPNNG